MSLIIKGMGTNVLTKGFGSYLLEVLREVLRLVSKIDTFMKVDSKWKRTS